jgi:hypothetical protein
MKKEDLRKVEFLDPKISSFSMAPNTDDKPSVQKNEWESSRVKKGLFHGWEKSVDYETRDEDTCAIIEREENGHVVYVPAEDVKFLN